MPITVPEALAAHEDSAAAKAEEARASIGRYLLSSLVAGAYVGAAVVLLLMVSSPLVIEGHPFTKLVQGSVFGIALVLVVFAGAELFTGNTMVMVQGLARRRVAFVDVVLVWAASLAGNLLGALALAGLVDASGLLTTGARPGSITSIEGALGVVASASSSLTGGQLFLRAVLCNALACLALWMATRAASDTAKLVALGWAALAFVATGFELSVASMTSLSLAAMTGVGTWGDLGRNLVYTVPGNIVGGGLLVGLTYAWLGRPAPIRPAPAPEPDAQADAEAAVVVEAPAPEPTPAPAAKRARKTTERKTTARKTAARKTTPRKATPTRRTATTRRTR